MAGEQVAVSHTRGSCDLEREQMRLLSMCRLHADNNWAACVHLAGSLPSAFVEGAVGTAYALGRHCDPLGLAAKQIYSTPSPRPLKLPFPTADLSCTLLKPTRVCAATRCYRVLVTTIIGTDGATGSTPRSQVLSARLHGTEQVSVLSAYTT